MSKQNTTEQNRTELELPPPLTETNTQKTQTHFNLSKMDPPNLGQNSTEDVSWLCSLSESELDLLISLKKLVIQKARMNGQKELAHKFDLKILRALAFILMTCIKHKVMDLSLVPGFEDSAAVMESCTLLKRDLGDVMSHEEIKSCIGIHLKKEGRKRFCNSITLKETTPSQKKQNLGNSEVGEHNCL